MSFSAPIGNQAAQSSSSSAGHSPPPNPSGSTVTPGRSTGSERGGERGGGSERGRGRGGGRGSGRGGGRGRGGNSRNSNSANSGESAASGGNWRGRGERGRGGGRNSNHNNPNADSFVAGGAGDSNSTNNNSNNNNNGGTDVSNNNDNTNPKGRGGGRGRGRGGGRNNNSNNNNSGGRGGGRNSNSNNAPNDNSNRAPNSNNNRNRGGRGGRGRGNNGNVNVNGNGENNNPEQETATNSLIGGVSFPTPAQAQQHTSENAMANNSQQQQQRNGNQQHHQHHLSLPAAPKAVGRGKGYVILSRQSHPPAAANATMQSAVPAVATHTTHAAHGTTASMDDEDDHDAHAHELSERLASAALEDDDDDDVIVSNNNNNNGMQQNDNGNGNSVTTSGATPSADAAVTNPTNTNSNGAKDGESIKQEHTETNGNGTKEPVRLAEKKKRPNQKNQRNFYAENVVEEVEPAQVALEPVVVAEPVITTQDALKALAGKEVSITATTQVKIRRNESSTSLEDTGPSKITPEMKNMGGKSSKKKKVLSTDTAANLKAARRFNNEVRSCVERSDPEGMRQILHDRHNHNFALDHIVLETVMKAYVMAAMFEEALYCLRNCTLPGTMSTTQTERILTCLPQNLRNSSAYMAADMINALCIATEFDSPTSRTYFLRIVRGIALEFLEEATSARDRICSAPCERLVRSGLCVVDSRLKRGKKPTELVVAPGEQLGVFVPDTAENRGIQAGDAVSILPYAGPYPMSAESLDRNMIEATVTNTNPMVIRLQDKTNTALHNMLAEDVQGNVYRIDKLANRMGFNRQLTAAVAIASPLGESKTRDNRRPCPELIKAITAMDENIERVMKTSGSMKKGEITSTAALCSMAVPWKVEEETEDYDQDSIRANSYLALEKYGSLEGLNGSQRAAVEGATSNRLTLVQGPPGTGKTAVAIRILKHWARLGSAASEKGENPSPILATSDSNIAVDNLVEGCAAVGLRVVRLGRPEAIRPELLRYCIDRPPSSYGNGGSGGGGGFKERMKQLKNAQVICCTCIGSGGDILDAITFDRILVDEATQATEPAVLVPLMRGCRQLVLVGDHCQLPPTVLSTRAEEEGHGVPLFSRMVACGVPPFMLDTQYRMHPCIAMFPSDLFYGGLLRNGVSAPERRPLAGFPWPREEFPVAFVSVKGQEMDDGVSKFNEAEAAAACDAVSALLAGGQCTVSDIAVVTPYAAQARLIRRMTRRLNLTAGPPFIEVSSVDGFQGREKEAVVFSAVRSNDYGAIGFTGDWRRINVSFTRSRRALIVIGNDQTLRRGDPDTWMPWLAWADAYGLNMDKPGVPRGRYEPEQLRRVRGGTTAAEMLKDVLKRQQAQLKNAEHMQTRAEAKAKGHIMGAGSGDDDDNHTAKDVADQAVSLEEDLAAITNAEGNWDDSDDEDTGALRHSASKATLTSRTSSNVLSETSSAVDIWDM